MKISMLRKIYPYLNHNMKNIKWRSLTDEEISRAMSDKQIIANCFDEAARYSLLASEKGRELLKKRIKIQKDAAMEPAYKITLHINGKNKTYKALLNDYVGKHFDLYKEYSNNPFGLSSFDYSNTRLSLGVNIAIRKMVKRHPLMKPLLARLYMFPLIKNRACEYNRPSNAFKWFTGIEPVSIGESDLKLNLKKHKDDVLELLQDLGQHNSKDYSFVAMTSNEKVKGIDKWHCLPILGVNNKNKTVKVLNKRTNYKTNISFDDFVNKFKAIVGIKF